MKFGWLLPLCVWGLFSCKAMPQADTGEGDPHEYGNEDFGGYDYDGRDLEEEEPSLALPSDAPSDVLPWELIEPSLESGEVFLPDSPPEETALVLAEPLPEPAPPELAEEAAPPEPPEEPPVPEAEPPELAEEPEQSPPEEPAPPVEPPPPEEPPPPALPPPPPRIVRPSEPVPPPPPAREPVPMPPRAVPDLPARNPPTLAPVPEPPPGASSRIVRALAGQTVEVPFRGSGWVYLGEASSKRGVNYASRRLDSEGQTFVFRAVETGTYELKFYRQDFIRDYIINDLVTVIVEEPPLPAAQSPRSGEAPDRSVAVAEPRWPTLAGRTAPPAGAAMPPAGAVTPPAGAATPPAGAVTPPARAATPPAGAVTPPAGAATPPTRADPPLPLAAAPSALPVAGPVGGPAPEEPPAVEPSLVLPEDMAAEEYLSRAREEYQGERYPRSLAILDQFLAKFPLGSDEAYWLYAQVCEKQGPSRNIRLALDYYRRLVAEYPRSSHYNDARRRIAYLERYYINIQ